jgi:hypothetical protein
MLKAVDRQTTNLGVGGSNPSAPCASCAGRTPPRPTCLWWRRLGKAAEMPFAVHPYMLRDACGFSPTMAMTPALCSTTLGTRTSSTRCATPSFPLTGSATSGGVELRAATGPRERRLPPASQWPRYRQRLSSRSSQVPPERGGSTQPPGTRRPVAGGGTPRLG